LSRLRFRRRPRVEELFVLQAMAALAIAALWLFWRRALLLEYFYFMPLLGLTHLVTLGFLSSIMMGVLYRLAPMLLGCEPASRRLASFQLVFFFVGAWGMVAHFWIGELKGMSWSAILVWGAACLQIVNFRSLFRPPPGGKAPWSRRFVAASLVHFFLAASLGVVIALAKAYDLAVPFLAPDPLSNVFAHAHLAGAGWVTSMIFGFQLELVPTTARPAWSVPYRFVVFQLAVLALAASFLLELPASPAAIALALCCLLQGFGPARAMLEGRAREWELLPLFLLGLASILGVALVLGWPEVTDPSRGRAQLAYGILAILGFMTLTVVTIAFKLFPIWVWKERFREQFGKKPVPGMKDLPSDFLRRLANLATFFGVWATAASVYRALAGALDLAVALLALGILAFVLNFLRVVRWSLLDLEYRPSAADEQKFREIFPSAPPARSQDADRPGAEKQ
jgi:hypothetical protein